MAQTNNPPIMQLLRGQLPRMVNWYDPRLLARIGVRTIISSVFGQYADQRLVQAATDQVPVEELCSRYDYSNPDASDERRIGLDGDGAFWIDYVADLGDGFEPTYAIAYLLSQPSWNVRGAGELKAGEILIMGGDQCYPQATREEYRERLQMPYMWAYNVPRPERKLFAIPGNHDWYDGLAAFDSLFCASRDRLSRHNTNRIGGWQPQQHRSYWAIKLPHNWWIWGADIQFSKYLDIAQVNYFRAIASKMGPDDNLILCLAEPAWMLAENQGQDEEQNFFKITAIARESGARICAVIAGDSHHYARYYTPELDVHFFTSGGGGAFLHPTHVLKNEITLRWPDHTGEPREPDLSATAGPEQRWSAGRYDIRLKNRLKGGPVTEAVDDILGPLQRGPGSTGMRQRDAKCYPSKARSMLLSLKNLFFPITNLAFGLGIGFIYWVVTWQYYSVVTRHDISAGKIDAATWETYPSLLARLPLYLAQGMLYSIPLVLMLAGLLAVLVWYVDAVERPRWKRWLVKGVVGTAHYLAHLAAMFAIGLGLVVFHNWISPSIERQVQALWQSRTEHTGIVREVLQETLEPLSQERIEQRSLEDRRRSADRGERPAPRSFQAPERPPADSRERVEYSQVRQLVGLVLYPVEMIAIGAVVGGFIWGFYWVLTGLFGRMHAADAFAALRIQDYKNFLRLKFEPHQVIIYPLGLDRVPRRSLWMAPPKHKAPPPTNPQLVPTARIDLKLIEEPIVIPARPRPTT